MKMRSPIPHKKARIEIIPLIDIMFFLLASFMMVSLSQTHMKGIRVNLPSINSPIPPPDEKKDFVAIRIAEGGTVYFDNALVNYDEVHMKLSEMQKANPQVKVSLSAETLALHGQVIDVLDKIRSVGITKIGYQIKAASPPGAPGTLPPSTAPPPPP